MRGFLSGAVVGALVSGLGVALASYYGPDVVVSVPPLEPARAIEAEVPSAEAEAEAPAPAEPPAAERADDPAALSPEAPASEETAAPESADEADGPQSDPAADAVRADDDPVPPTETVAAEAEDGAAEGVAADTEVPGASGEDDAASGAVEFVPVEEDATGEVVFAAPDGTAPEDEAPGEAADDVGQAGAVDGAAELSDDGDTANDDASATERAFAEEVAGNGGLRLPVPDPEELAPPPPGGGQPAPDGAAAPAEPATPEGPALTAFATPFDLPSSTPVLSIVLLDPGEGARPDPATLRDFPVPLTIAVDPTRPGATEAMAAYRRAGHEVAVLVPLSEGASEDEVAAALQTYLAAVPEAVALLDTPEARLQENRQRATLISGVLTETGHGLVTYDRGLNSGLQAVQGAGVPATAVFRDFDDGIREISAMKRLLDVGAFRAAQEGTVVLTGTLRPEAITALTEWVLGSRAATVSIAPVSALLRSLE